MKLDPKVLRLAARRAAVIAALGSAPIVLPACITPSCNAIADEVRDEAEKDLGCPHDEIEVALVTAPEGTQEARAIGCAKSATYSCPTREGSTTCVYSCTRRGPVVVR